MILAALNDYYRRLSAAGEDDLLPAPGFAVQKVGGAIQLDADGRFLGLLPLLVPAAKGKERPRPMVVPQPPIRTSGVEAAFLCDTGGYLLARDVKGKPERVRQQFEASATLHRTVLAGLDAPAARAVLRHFATWDPKTTLTAGSEDLLAGFLVFVVNGAFVHEHPLVREAWLGHVEAMRSTRLGQCMVTGADGVPLARLHTAIKGAGGQSSGTYLVSFNFDAAVSYGGGQEFSVPVGEAAAFGYAAVLNHLLQWKPDRARTIGDMTVVMWADRPCAGENLLMQLFDPVGLGADEDAPPEDRDRAARVRDALDCIMRGDVPADLKSDSDVRFYVLGLSPNAARLSVRLWYVSTLGELIDHVRCHQHDLALIPDGPRRAPYPALWTLVNETRAKDKDGRARGRADTDRRFKLHGDLLRAAITGAPYPAALVPELLARFRADGHLTHPRVALLKAVVQRARRIDEPQTKDLPMALDDSRTEPGYLLGRLFAALERLQNAAQGPDINRTIRDSHLGAASTTPRAAFNHLLGLSEAHRRKGRRENPGGVVVADKVVSRVMNDLRDIPAVLAPDDQALFFLGYYQQRQDFFTPKRGETTAADTV